MNVTDLDNVEPFMGSSTYNEAYTWQAYTRPYVGLYQTCIPYIDSWQTDFYHGIIPLRFALPVALEDVVEDLYGGGC